MSSQPDNDPVLHLPDARELAAALDQVMIRDRHRLRTSYRRTSPGASNRNARSQTPSNTNPNANPNPNPNHDPSRGRDTSDARTQAWLKAFEQSKAECEKRRQSIGPLSFDPELPITARRQEIIDTLRSRQTLVLCGETGSGKSTQLPKICLEAGLGVRGWIGHTQPRRLAARAVAMRLAEELGARIGEQVGFKIRFTDKTAPSTLIKLMTDGVLLAETQSDRFLDQYEAIIIDEAHERSLNIDFLLAYLKQLIVKRPDLKLIITSATIDPQKFADHFADDLGPAPIIEVQGRTYPVEIRYRDVDELSDDVAGVVPISPTDGTPLTALAHAVDECCATGQGDVLVFLPTERDIRLTHKYLRGWFTMQGRLTHVDILPLYARLSEAEQNKIFQPHGQRRIVLATNVAESSLTVPGIHFVVDTGTARISRYAPRQRVQRLPIEAVSQASANQRAGRCGRLGPGVCIRLYSQSDYDSRPKFTTPEIRRSDLAAVILQCATLRLGPLLELPLLDPPSPEAVRDGQRTLLEIGAMNDRQELTEIGRKLGRLPCDPRVGRMLLAAHERNVLGDVLVIAAALESQDVRLRPAGQQPAADEAHQEFRDPHSDFLGLLRLWHFYERLRSSLSRSRLGKALEQKFLSLQRYREWADIVRQLKEMLADAGLKATSAHMQLPSIELEQAADAKHRQSGLRKPDMRQPDMRLPDAKGKVAEPKNRQRPEGYDAVHQALLTGLLSGIGTLGDNRQYLGTHNSTFSLWPGSGLFQRTPKWVVAAEMLETTRRYGRIVAEIDVAWIESLAGPLLKSIFSDPHWSRKAQAAMVYRRSTLYGLPVVDRRQVALAPIDPELARKLLITHALVGGESQCREKFLLHNQQLLVDLQQLAERTRRRDLIVDPYVLEQFYAERLPAEVIDLPSLRKWLNRHTGSEAEKSLYLQAANVLGRELDQPPPEHFPEQLQIGPTRLPLNYRFSPGDATDGVTVTVPQAALRQVSDEALGWLVPGLLEDKLLHMIKSLPKHLRRNFVPAPDVARKLAGELLAAPRDVPFSTTVCQLMSRYAEEPITPADFEWDKLPEHLRFRINVINDAGKLVESSRDLNDLQSRLASESAAIVAPVAASPVQSQWNGQRITSFALDRIPDSIVIMRGGVKVAAFPALVDEGESVTMRLMDNAEEADRVTRLGWLRLFVIKCRRDLIRQVSHLPALDKSSVYLGRLLPAAKLRDQLCDLIARIAFIEGQETIREKIDFEARAADAARRISIATQDVALWLPPLAEHYQAVRLVLESAPALWKEVADDISLQIQELTADDFLHRVPWSDLKEYPRYLQAARIRWDKLRSGGLPKDRKLREAIDRLVGRLRSWSTRDNSTEGVKAGSSTASPAMHSVRMLIEELRVSTFAQQLGTRQSVSVKKVEQALDQLTR